MKFHPVLVPLLPDYLPQVITITKYNFHSFRVILLLILSHCHSVALLLTFVHVLSHFNHVQFFVTLWTVALQAPLSMEFSRQEYWSGLLCPPPGDLPE